MRGGTITKVLEKQNIIFKFGKPKTPHHLQGHLEMMVKLLKTSVERVVHPFGELNHTTLMDIEELQNVLSTVYFC